MKTITILIVVITITGCATMRRHFWSMSDGSIGNYPADHSVCRMQANQSLIDSGVGGIHRGHLMDSYEGECMRGKGWVYE